MMLFLTKFRKSARPLLLGTALAVASWASTPLKAAPVHFADAAVHFDFRFDTGTANVPDQSGNNNHGSKSPGLGSTSTGWEFTAGASEAITIPHHTSLNFTHESFTVEFWASRNDSTQNRFLLDTRGATASPGFLVGIGMASHATGPNRLLLHLNAGSGTPGNIWSSGANGFVGSTGDMQHLVVAVEYTGSNAATVHFYIDGNAAGSENVTVNPSAIPQSHNWVLGNKHPGSGSGIQPLSGEIGAFRAYDRLLTPTEIQESYAYGFIPEPATGSLLLMGLLGLGLTARRRR